MELSQAVSPLTAYRGLFADDVFEQTLFTVTGDDAPARVRLAVLDDYDGATFRTDPDGAPFVRVASARDAGAGAAVDIDVTLGTLGAAFPTGIWMPSAGTLASVTFQGSRAATLSDGFYVSDALSAAVQTTPWLPGDAYRLRAVQPSSPALSAASAPGGQGSGQGGELDGVEAPASLRTWVEQHVSGTGGAALEQLVALLRNRGYLSHALTDPGTALWMNDLGGYEFAPSASGHSLARIDDLFTDLLEREADPRAAASGNYVAAVGDDEQFSVAVALIARELGFPARIVVGARLTSDDASVATCQAGACRAGDISAWVEVRAASGEWIAVDVTPQHTQAPSREVTEQPDPTIGTAVRPDGVDEVLPPKSTQEDSSGTAAADQGPDLAWLWATLRVSGLVVAGAALIAGPFVLILVAKAVRRRGRRRAPEPVDRIAGGWEEYLDAATDAGHAAPAAATRTEVAAALEASVRAGAGVAAVAAVAAGSDAAAAADAQLAADAQPAADAQLAADAAAAPTAPVGAAGLAARADEAVFSSQPATADDAEEFWRIVEAEREALAPAGWRRWRAALSLRSFLPAALRTRAPRGVSARRARPRGAARAAEPAASASS
ncbi:transglutaminase domain-containing protein [Microbacterium sp.]|uniref:transglutaminase domain-containing protein n=1 Tax=Microbacterium sp. TaxID=51671 RepID=UPI0039E4AC61